jgi:DNA repair exonuclease SbcCD ATPase subunit
MKILNAIIENYKAIHRVEIFPSGNVTVISGNNASGKTSAIEAIITTLAGKDKNTIVPVRKGENGSIIEIDLGDYKVVRTISADGKDELNVYDKQGFVSKKPRTRLNELIDDRKFNVMTFVSGSPKEQRALLLDLACISFGKIDARKSDIYNERTMIGRERDSLKGQLDGMPEISDVPEKLIDTQEILNQIKENNEYNNGIKSNQMNMQSWKDKKGMLEMEITQIKDKLKMLESQLEGVNSNISQMEKGMAGVELKDNSILENKLKNAEELNNKFRSKIKRDEVSEKYNAKSKEYGDKTLEYEMSEKEKIEMLKNAKFPIEGLSVSDEGVLYNNLPLDQESHSNRIKIALSIAMAMPSELRTIILDDAEIIDDDNMKVIDDWAVKNEYQIIIARRSEPADNVITIKEGKINEPAKK